VASFTYRVLALGLLLPAAAAACRDDSVLTGASPPSVGVLHTEGWASPGEIRSGYVLDANDRPVLVTYTVHGNEAYLQGDINLGPADAIPSTPPLAGGAGGPRHAVALASSSLRWTSGVVPYVIDRNVDASVVRAGIAMIEGATTSVDFVARTNERDYVRVVASDGCSSNVGRTGGEQKLRFSPDCGAGAGNVAHEFLHALGIQHEQGRCDRDEFIEILTRNIPSERRGQYDKYCGSTYVQFGNYNPGSIMHYPARLTYVDGSGRVLRTVRVIRARVPEWEEAMGQRKKLGGTDVKGVESLYPSRIPVHRRYNAAIPDHFYTRTASEGTRDGWRTEANDYFYLASGSGSGYRWLYRCNVEGRHFVSLEQYCEAGVRAEEEMGRVATTQQPGTRPLYRLRHPKTRDRLTTWDTGERDRAVKGGYRLEGTTGFAWVRSN
jgi:hypothetical protein